MAMLNKRIVVCAFIIFLFGVSYLGLTMYSLSTNDIEELLTVCLIPESTNYPSKLAEYYLLNHRGVEKDIEALRKNKGIGFIFNSEKEPEKMIKYANFILSKGLDINMVGRDGLTALHVSVLFNQPKITSFLLSKGADPTVKVGMSKLYGVDKKMKISGMSALELAEALAAKGTTDRSEIIALLK